MAYDDGSSADVARTPQPRLKGDDQLNLLLDRFPGAKFARQGGQHSRRHMTGLLGGRSDGVVVDLAPKGTGR